MSNDIGYYSGSEQSSAFIGKALNVPSLQRRIDNAVQQAEDRLKKVKEAQEILSRNPDLERLLDIMQQSHF